MSNKELSKSAVVIVGAVASALFAVILAVGSYKAKYNYAAYLLFGLAMLLAYYLLASDGYVKTLKQVGCVTVFLFVAFAIRMCYIDVRSGDYNSFLQHWAQFYRANGGIKALGEPVGDYNIPYLYILALISYVAIDDLYMIKFVSVLFDVLLAFYAMRLCTLLTDNEKVHIGTFFAVLMLPTVFLNSSWWAQCDSIYTAFALAALYYGLKGRPFASMLMATLSFAFKLQAIFLLPIFAVLLMTGKLKWKYIPLVPLFYAVLVLPAIVAGRPALDAITIYLTQTGEYANNITLNAPTLAVVFDRTEDVSGPSKLLIALAFVYLASLLVVAFTKRKSLDDRKVIMLTLAMAIGIPYLLPSMHERYFYIAEVLSVVCVAGGLANIAIPALIQAASMICYDAYITGYYRLRLGLASSLMAAALILVVITLVQTLRASAAKGSPQNK